MRLLFPLYLLVLGLATGAAGQTSFTRSYSYRQTSADTVTPDQFSLVISYRSVASSADAEETVQAIIDGETITLEKITSSPIVLGDGLGTQISLWIYEGKKNFPTAEALRLAPTSPLVTIKSSLTGNSTVIMPGGSGTTITTKIVNFDLFQDWRSSTSQVAWLPIAGVNTLNPPSVSIVRPGEPTLFFSGLFYVDLPSPPLPPGVVLPLITSAVPSIYFTPVDGEILEGALTVSQRLSSSSATTVNQIYVLRFPVKKLAPAPIISSQPRSVTAIVGSAASLSVEIAGSGVTYAWQKNGTLIAGAKGATLSFANVKDADAGSYTVTATNSGGSVTSNTVVLTVAAPVVAPAITTAPASATLAAGGRANFTVAASGTGPFTYQWSRNGTALAGATTSTLTIDSTLLANAGDYTVTVTNSAGSITSAAAVLTVTPISRISNLSVLTSLSGAGDNFTLGYVVGGGGTSGGKPLILRAAGPALAALGVAGTLDDPKVELYTGQTKTLDNDNWGGSAELSAAFVNVGAFPFATATSKDAAVATSLTTRDNSVKVSVAGTGAGLVLAEIYDASADAAFVSTTPRLVNVSVLKSLGTGLTVGFTIAGSTPKTVIIRAIGPTLGGFGVAGTVADPQLVLFNSSSVKINENNDWGGTAALQAAFDSVGAFGLAATAKDAALVATLPPGGYSVQVTGANASTGVALVEVYEVP